MHMKTGWLLYEDHDYALNRDFANLMAEEGKRRGFSIEPVLSSQIVPILQQSQLFCLRDGRQERPDFIISRQRDSRLSEHFERMGVPVYNNARVCEIGNDKRKTHQFLQGLPMLDSAFLFHRHLSPPQGTVFPVILKPAQSHGGDRILWVRNEEEWHIAASQILPEPMVQQEIATDYGRDLRVYVVFGQIVAAVMRVAKDGFISNFKQGGQVYLHQVTHDERALAGRVIARFAKANAPLCFAGIDFLYHRGKPVVSEVEDVVGSRMLYQVSDINIASLYLDGILADLRSKK